MPQYQYLNNNNLWGDQAESMGGAFNNAVLGMTRLRYQQALQAQQQAMDRAYLDLAVRKLNQSKSETEQQFEFDRPLRQAQTAESLQKTEESKIRTQSEQATLEDFRKTQAMQDLVNSAMQARQNIMNPAPQVGPTAGGVLAPFDPSMAQNIGMGAQNQYANAINGILMGAGAQRAMMAPNQIGNNLPQLMLSQTPQGLQDVAAGYRPNPAAQHMTPEQAAMLGLSKALLSGEFKSPLANPDDISGIVNRAMESFGVTNAPAAQLPKGPNAATGSTQPVVISNDEEYDALAPGALYVSPDGKTRRKSK